jgi:hypothetical protein
MTNWTSGYVADIDYNHDFFRELTPAHMGFCALSQGHNHGLNQPDLTYCELGCGQGFSANLLAAANPHVDFHAMDFNPAHMAGAINLAQDAKLDNVHFYERSFENFADASGLPQDFDVIALHGVYSWVSKAHQKHITNFISKRLKSGGLVYISYNTLPGWAPVMPLRRILTNHADQGSGPLETRIQDALDFAQQLEQVGAGFFSGNPAAAKRLEQMKSKSANYLAHEYFNKDWTPFHFEDVAADLSQAKLSFLGSAEPRDHVDDVSFTPKQQTLIQAESDPVRRESLRDIVLNEQFRTDLFVKGKLQQSPRGSIAAWFTTPLALTRQYGGGSMKLSWRGREIPVTQDHYGPALKALETGPMTVRALLEQGVFGEMPWAEISRLLTLLIGEGYIAPSLPQEGLAERTERCRTFNTAVAKRSEESQALQFFASPVTGGGIALDRFEQLFLLARSEGRRTPGDWADLAWQILEPQGQRLQKDGRILETPEENLAVLRVRATAFAARRLALCENHGLALEQEQPTQRSKAAA